MQINKAMIGFLTHSGYSHGGNGFEGMAFLIDQFKDADLKDPTESSVLKEMADKKEIVVVAAMHDVGSGRVTFFA